MSGAVVTIGDVARAASCLIATVRRVTTGSSPVADATRQRVAAAALTPNFALGRGGAASRVVLGVLVPSLANPSFAGIERCARMRGVSTAIAQSHYLPEGEEDGVRALMAERLAPVRWPGSNLMHGWGRPQTPKIRPRAATTALD